MPTWTKEQQEAIYKSGENIIVSAGAGSGKTAVLSERVIEKLKNHIHINELLILTFTTAAAEEMKERIRKKIKKEASLKKELEILDSAYITTFDSFALSIVRKYHYLFQLPPSPEITDEAIIEIIKKDTLRETLDTYYKQENFTKILDDFCIKDDEEIYETLLQISNKLEKNIHKEEYLENYLENFYNPQTIQKMMEEFEKIVLFKKKEFQKELTSFCKDVPKDYVKKCMDAMQNLLNANDLDTLYTLKSTKFPPLPRQSSEEMKEKKEICNKKRKELNLLLEYGPKGKLLCDYQKMQPIVEVLLQILKDYFKRLETKKRTMNYYDFTDIAAFALRIVTENEKIKEELKNSFQEIMIDEYQDTNDIQESLINQIANHNVYMVGDIKQSIYRFRDANPTLFKRKYNAYKEHENGYKIDLLKNFRSRSEVLTNINLMFNQLMNENFGGANYVEEHQMNFGNLAYDEEGNTSENYNMEILHYPQSETFTKEEIEAFLIAQDIQTKIKEGYQLFDKEERKVHSATYQDFVILMDRSTNFSLYKKIFNYFKIPISIYQDETLNQSACFKIIKNLLKLVISYHQKNFDNDFKLAWTSIARSFLFSIPDEEIYQVLTTQNWFQNEIYLSIKDTIENSSSKTSDQIIKKLLNDVNFYEKLIQIGNIKENMIAIEHIEALAKNYSKKAKNIMDFYELINRITKEEMNIKVSINENMENSVKLMTIHKSKGLEYPICYFSGLYKKFNISEISDKFLYDPNYGILTPLKEEGIYPNFMKELVKNNYLQEEISEKIRLFYVATTRAKEKMIFLLPVEDEVPKSSLQCRSMKDFLYQIFPLIKQYKKEINLKDIPLSKDYLLDAKKEFVKKEAIPFQVQEIIIPKEQKETSHFSKTVEKINKISEYQNIQLGLKFHEYLENIDFKNPNYDQIKEPFIRQKITQFINSPLMKAHLTDTFYKEYEFIYEEEKMEYHGIIDLLIETPKEMIIIDYKLEQVRESSYQKQLEGYQKYIAKKTNKPVKTYLYSILDEHLEMLSLEK